MEVVESDVDVLIELLVELALKHKFANENPRDVAWLNYGLQTAKPYDQETRYELLMLSIKYFIWLLEPKANAWNKMKIGQAMGLVLSYQYTRNLVDHSLREKPELNPEAGITALLEFAVDELFEEMFEDMKVDPLAIRYFQAIRNGADAKLSEKLYQEGFRDGQSKASSEAYERGRRDGIAQQKERMQKMGRALMFHSKAAEREGQ